MSVSGVGYADPQLITMAAAANNIVGLTVLKHALDAQSESATRLLKGLAPVEGAKGTHLDVSL